MERGWNIYIDNATHFRCLLTVGGIYLLLVKRGRELMVSLFPNIDALDNCLGRMAKSFHYFQDKQKVRHQIKAPISQWISSLHIYHIKQKCNYFNPWNKYYLNSWTKFLILFLAVP